MAGMSTLERWLVNSPIRAWLHRREIDAFLRWSRIAPGSAVLDMGCGPGVSTALLRKKARPRLLVAFDFDAAMVARARRRVHSGGHPSKKDTPLPGETGTVHLLVADASRMPFRDGAFDAVVESGVVHHVPDWRAALSETSRVLKSGGEFCFAEPSRGRLHRLYRLLPHDPASTFDEGEWRSALDTSGLAVEGPLRRLPLWDLCGIATRVK